MADVLDDANPTRSVGKRVPALVPRQRTPPRHQPGNVGRGLITHSAFQGGATVTGPGVVDLRTHRVHTLTSAGNYTLEVARDVEGGPVGYLLAEGGSANILDPGGFPVGSIPSGHVGKVHAYSTQRYTRPVDFGSYDLRSYMGRDREADQSWNVGDTRNELVQAGTSWKALRLPSPTEVTRQTWISFTYRSPLETVGHAIGLAADLSGDPGTGSLLQIWGDTEVPLAPIATDAPLYTAGGLQQVIEFPIGRLWTGVANFLVLVLADSVSNDYEPPATFVMNAAGSQATFGGVVGSGELARLLLFYENDGHELLPPVDPGDPPRRIGVPVDVRLAVNGATTDTLTLGPGVGVAGADVLLQSGTNTLTLTRLTATTTNGGLRVSRGRTTQTDERSKHVVRDVRVFERGQVLTTTPLGVPRPVSGPSVVDALPLPLPAQPDCGIPRFRLEPCAYFGGPNEPREEIRVSVTRGSDYGDRYDNFIFPSHALGEWVLVWNGDNERYEIEDGSNVGVRRLSIGGPVAVGSLADGSRNAGDGSRGSPTEAARTTQSVTAHGAQFFAEAFSTETSPGGGEQTLHRYNVEVVYWGPVIGADAEAGFLFVADGLDGEEGNEVFINGLCYQIFPNTTLPVNGELFSGTLPPSNPPGTSGGPGGPGSASPPGTSGPLPQEGLMPPPIPMCEHDGCVFVEGGSGTFTTNQFGGCSGTLTMDGRGCSSWIGSVVCQDDNFSDNPGGYLVSHSSTGGVQVWNVGELDSNLSFRAQLDIDPRNAGANVEVETSCNGFTYREFHTFTGSRVLSLSYEFTLS